MFICIFIYFVLQLDQFLWYRPFNSLRTCFGLVSCDHELGSVINSHLVSYVKSCKPTGNSVYRNVGLLGSLTISCCQDFIKWFTNAAVQLMGRCTGLRAMWHSSTQPPHCSHIQRSISLQDLTSDGG